MCVCSTSPGVTTSMLQHAYVAYLHQYTQGYSHLFPQESTHVCLARTLYARRRASRPAC